MQLAPGVAPCSAGDHADDETASGAHGQCVHRRRHRHPAQLGQGQQGKADHDPGVGQVQDPQNGTGARDPGVPLRQAHGMQHSGQRTGHERHRAGRCQYPQRQRQGRHAQGRQLAPAGDLDFQARIDAHGESRDYAPGHHGFDHHNHRQTRVQRLHWRNVDDAQHAQVKRQIGAAQQHQHADQRQIAAVLSAQQDTQQDDAHGGQQQHIEHGIHHIRPRQPSDPRGGPQHEQGAQRRTPRRCQPRPRLDGGEQKAGNDASGKAKQHFMGVPEQRRDRQLQVDPAQKGGDPQRHRQTGHQCGADIKRSKAQAQNGPVLQRDRRYRSRLGRRQDGQFRGFHFLRATDRMILNIHSK